MHGWKKRPLVFLIVASLVLFASTFPAAAAGEHPGEEITTESIMADFMLLRPLGVAASVVGTGFFLVSLPFSVLGGNTKMVFEKTVAEPFRFTFFRPLGKVEY